ncbi:proton-conducting transporter membrane subunit, partial [Singulisphaera rosea]
MPDYPHAMMLLGLVVVGSPLVLTSILGVSSLLGHKPDEETTSLLVYVAIVSGLSAALAVLALMLGTGVRHVPIVLGDWVVIPHHYRFSVKFVFDRLSVPFAILSYVLSGTIAAFASKYMHREWGFNRFFVLYSLFLLGMIVTSLAGTIETLFAGWELVGLSSALLVAFFQERPAPSRNGLWVWTVYRVSDAALLLA